MLSINSDIAEQHQHQHLRGSSTVANTSTSTSTSTKHSTPLTIRKPESLDAQIEKLICEATAAMTSANRGVATARINKHDIICQATPKVSNGDAYVLFYRDGKRTSRSRLHQELGISVTA